MESGLPNRKTWVALSQRDGATLFYLLIKKGDIHV